MAKRRRLSVETATERIASSIEKALAGLSPKQRNARLRRIHEIAARAGETPRETPSTRSETPATPLYARPHEES